MNKPIFITARFRSGSTLLWNIFHQIPDAHAYYEPLHEQLPQLIRRHIKPQARHYFVDSYFNEYPDVDELERHHSPEFGMTRLHMEARDDFPSLKNYIDYLLTSIPSNKIPALQFNRIDLRLPWIKQHYPDAVLLHLYRSSRDQWVSTISDHSEDVDQHIDADPYRIASWSRDLCRQFPFLATPFIRHAYQRHYYLWKLSLLAGQRLADLSISYEDLILQPRQTLRQLFDLAGLNTEKNISRCLKIIKNRPIDVWKEYRNNAWFSELEEECEATLNKLGLNQHFGKKPLSKIILGNPAYQSLMEDGRTIKWLVQNSQLSVIKLLNVADEKEGVISGSREFVQKLQEANRGFQEDNQGLQEGMRGLRDINQGLLEANQALQSANQSLQGANMELQESNLSLQEDNQGFQEGMRGLRDINQGLLEANQALQSANQSLQGANLELQESNLSLQEDNQGLQEGMQGLQKANQNLLENNQGLQEANQNLLENSQALQEANQNLLENNQGLQKANQNLLENSRVLQEANQNLLENNQMLQEANQNLLENNQMLQKANQGLQDVNQKFEEGLLLRDKIIQLYRTSLDYWLDNGPLRRLFTFPMLATVRSYFRSVAHRVRDFRRIFLPKIGILYQHNPIPLRVAKHYAEFHAPDPGRASRISIVTPTHNQAALIERTAKSVLDQAYPNLEYIVQDEGSTDETLEVMRPYLGRLAHFESCAERGQARAFNLGTKNTNGEIMACLNSGDILLPGSLNYVADYFTRHPAVDVIYGHRLIINGNDEQIGHWILPRHDNDILLWADFVPQETVFWRRRIWEKAGSQVEESYQFAAFWDMLVRFRAAGAKFVRVPRFLAAFRVPSARQDAENPEEVRAEETNRLLRQIHQREIRQDEVLNNIASYLNRSVWYHKLHWLGLLRY